MLGVGRFLVVIVPPKSLLFSQHLVLKSVWDDDSSASRLCLNRHFPGSKAFIVQFVVSRFFISSAASVIGNYFFFTAYSFIAFHARSTAQANVNATVLHPFTRFLICNWKPFNERPKPFFVCEGQVEHLTQVPTYQPFARCLKITEKVSFKLASEASYFYILSGQKLIKNAKKMVQSGEFLKIPKSFFVLIIFPRKF